MCVSAGYHHVGDGPLTELMLSTLFIIYILFILFIIYIVYIFIYLFIHMCVSAGYHHVGDGPLTELMLSTRVLGLSTTLILFFPFKFIVSHPAPYIYIYIHKISPFNNLNPQVGLSRSSSSSPSSSS
jgi:hypothetical protein